MRRISRCVELGLVVAIVASFAIGSGALAALSTLYVDGSNASCSDSNSGTSSAPLCTISKAASIATAGQTVQVAAGTYNEDVAPANSGSSGSPIVYQTAPGATVTVGQGKTDGFTISSRSYITVQGFTVTGTTGYGISVTSSNNISVISNRVSFSGQPVSGSTKAGIYISNTNNSLIKGNTSFQNSDHGIYVTGTSTGNTITGNVSYLNAEQYQRNANGINLTAPGNSVIGNFMSNNEDSGINVYPGANNTLVASNVTYNNGDHGIDDLNVTGGRIIGNTVFHNCTDGINVEGTSGSYTVENNISVDNSIAVVNPTPMANGLTNNCNRRKGNIGIYDSAPSSTTADYNVSYMSVSTDATTGGSPVWYNWAATSYRAGQLSSLQSASGQEGHGIWANPLWKSTSLLNPDFHLTSGSPAIDSANTLVSGQQPTDIEGNSPYDDRGAYEYGGSGGGTDSPPTASLTVSPSSGTAPLQVAADASGSTDTDATPIATYTFNFGDGTAAVGPQAGPTAPHTYNRVGTFTVTVTVTDTGNLSSTAQKMVTVQADAPPSAVLKVTPSSGSVGVQVAADASGSTDADATPIATYTFNFGDGTAAVGPQAGATATHTYNKAGTYTVTATVTDTANLSSTATATVSVSDSAPSASLTVNPTSGTVSFPITADASGSTDPDATPIATYTFDFGDGTILTPQANPTATHTYSNPGIYTVKVTVKDTANLSSTATATVTASSQNLVTNPGFESNTNGWAPLPSSNSLTRTSSVSHTGNYSALITNTSSKRQTCGLNDSPNWVPTTSAGVYTAQIWVQGASSGGSFKLQLTEYSGSTSVGSATTSVSLSKSWQLVTVTYTIKSPGSTLDFNAYTTQKPGDCFYADDISITFA